MRPIQPSTDPRVRCRVRCAAPGRVAALLVAAFCVAAGLAGCGGANGHGADVPAVDSVAAVAPAPASAPAGAGPTLSVAPASQSVSAGATVRFAVRASGKAPLAYRWLANGVDVTGATGSSLSFTAAGLHDGNRYTVVVTDGAGNSTVSTPATLAVSLPAELSGLTGRLAFLRTARSQEARSGTLLLYDFGTRSLAAVSGAWSQVFYPKNPAFSPDGSLLVFAAYCDAAASEEDIFVWRVGSASPPVNLTPSSGERNEDPKFSPDGTRIVFKRNGAIAMLTLADPGRVYRLTGGAGEPEASQPYFMPDGVQVVFSAMVRPGDPASQVIRMLDVSADGIASGLRQVADGPGLQEFFPIAWGPDRVLFTRWRSATDRSDVIVGYGLSTLALVPLAFNTPGCDNADPFPADGQSPLVFFVDNCAGGAGGFDLVVGSVSTGKRYPLSLVDPRLASSDDELGPVYSSRR